MCVWALRCVESVRQSLCLLSDSLRHQENYHLLALLLLSGSDSEWKTGMTTAAVALH